jgi:hypothetical protein
MAKWLVLTKSSFADPFNGLVVVNAGTSGVNTNPKLWRAVQASLSCALDGNAQNTGYVHITTLEEYDSITGVATGNTKANTPGDANYMPDYMDVSKCPIPNQTVNNVNIIVGNSGKTYDVYINGGNGSGAQYAFNNVGAGGTQGNIPVDIYEVMIRYTSPTHMGIYAAPTTINGVVKNSTMTSYFLTNNISAPITISLP